MNTSQGIIFGFVVLIILSFGMGYIAGGPVTGKKIVAWELKQLKQILRFVLKTIFKTVGTVCLWISKKI